MQLKTLLLYCGLVFVSSCSQIPIQNSTIVDPIANASTTQSAWKNRQLLLSRKQRWGLKSKIALRYRDEHWTFGLNWDQSAPHQYVMQIKNPVTGSVLAELTKSGRGVSLLSDDGKTYRDVDEERLLANQSGVKLPIRGMQYWVRGLASPVHRIDKLVLDTKGRPQAILQAGWSIDYSRYDSSRVDAMPRKVVITRNKDNVYLKMIAKQWR